MVRLETRNLDLGTPVRNCHVTEDWDTSWLGVHSNRGRVVYLSDRLLGCLEVLSQGRGVLSNHDRSKRTGTLLV